MADSIQASIKASLGFRGSVTADARYSFTGQFILGAKHFAELAAEIEDKAEVTERDRMQHRAYVAAAIMQSVAALESEVWQITRWGPGQHLGSNATDTEARDFLDPLKDEIDNLPILRRFEVILHMLGIEPINRGHKPYQHASLLVQLRNAITHYKSLLGAEMDDKKLYRNLAQLGHKKPTFAENNQNFFPHLCLSAECADWAWHTADEFLTEFSAKLGKPSVLDRYLRTT